jgi:hypothetical protein
VLRPATSIATTTAAITIFQSSRPAIGEIQNVEKGACHVVDSLIEPFSFNYLFLGINVGTASTGGWG